ncbi:hypothetical protein [Spirosoma gilvum]
MNPFNEFFNDGRPFALDACGDTMWDEVLNQPEPAQKQHTTLPPITLETASTNDSPVDETDRQVR